MSSRAIAAWVLPLKGHSFDLEDLPVYLSGSPVTVVKRADGYFLHLSASVAGEDYERVRDLATEFLALINGTACIIFNGYCPVELERGGILGIDANGDVAQTVLQMDSAQTRHKAGHVTLSVNGVAKPDDRLGLLSALVEEASHCRAKADAVTLIGRPSPSWSELYLIFELVEANVGGRMYTDGWITKADAKLFTRTANSYTALGRAARHGKDTADPPIQPMSLKTAVTLMRTLVGQWLRSPHE